MLAGLLVVCAGIPMAVQAAPGGQADSPAAESHRGSEVRAQLKDVDAKISTARAHNDDLQAQVTRLEQQNAERSKQLQQRDAEIAALQKKLQAAGVPPSPSSTDR
jgi:septal ring factor EnvC (AmiA/AmiB activator)